MSLAKVESRAVSGINAPEVSVEVHLTRGLPAFSIVGLPEAAVRESRDRVRSAIMNSGFDFPRYRITVNLAPADLPKEGGRYDLAIAIGILAASSQVPNNALTNKVFVGELALSGQLLFSKGVLVTAVALRKIESELIVPFANQAEAALLPDANIYLADSLIEVVRYLGGQASLPKPVYSPPESHDTKLDMADVRGQTFAKRALEIAAAGQHNLLFYGPPGTGKTMLASRLPSILPELSLDEALETAAIHSISQRGLNLDDWFKRPFRAPHHSASSAAIVGGGSKALPGEISLAHNGVLFLDELTEFERKVLETMREPLESGEVSISRAAQHNTYPASIQLIAAMNPCNCGYYGDATQPSRCHCTPDQIHRYRAKISGPLLDRIDIHLEVPRVSHEELTANNENTAVSSAEIRKSVIAARNIQLNRQGCLNAKLDVNGIDTFCQLDQPSQQMLQKAMDRLGLSARAYHRILKLARTIADLASDPSIQLSHVGQAIQMRSFDRPV